MARPINPDSRGEKYWNYVIVMMGRLRSSMMIDTQTEAKLALETIQAADRLIELSQQHKAEGKKPTHTQKPPATG